MLNSILTLPLLVVIYGAIGIAVSYLYGAALLGNGWDLTFPSEPVFLGWVAVLAGIDFVSKWLYFDEEDSEEDA